MHRLNSSKLNEDPTYAGSFLRAIDYFAAENTASPQFSKPWVELQPPDNPKSRNSIDPSKDAAKCKHVKDCADFGLVGPNCGYSGAS
jgi:hypothetical protein